MNKFILLIFFLLIISINFSVAQKKSERTDFTKHSVYAELFGQGILYSINYEYGITSNIRIRAGFSSWSITSIFILIDGKISYTGFPLMINYLTGKKNSHLELGTGFMPSFFSFEGTDILFGKEYYQKANLVVGVATIGYRFQKQERGLIFRVGLTPLFTLNKIAVSGGISLGYSF